MKIHHLRNATIIIETGAHRLLVDPMLSDKGELPPFSFIRYKAQRNPLVELPANTDKQLAGITHCLITHSQTFGIKALQHTDHLDSRGETFLIENDIPVFSRSADTKYLEKLGLRVTAGVNYWGEQPLEEGRIVAVPAQHGHGWNHHLMANGAGFILEFPNEPSVYIAGDTVYTKDVERALTEFKPDIAIAPAGAARLDIGPPILMSLDEIVSFTRKVPGKVILNHLEALNHCPTTRAQLRETLSQHGVLEKAIIPEDGETIIVNQ